MNAYVQGLVTLTEAQAESGQRLQRYLSNGHLIDGGVYKDPEVAELLRQAQDLQVAVNQKVIAALELLRRQPDEQKLIDRQVFDRVVEAYKKLETFDSPIYGHPSDMADRLVRTAAQFIANDGRWSDVRDVERVRSASSQFGHLAGRVKDDLVREYCTLVAALADGMLEARGEAKPEG
jgi:hypothetical protein